MEIIFITCRIAANYFDIRSLVNFCLDYSRNIMDSDSDSSKSKRKPKAKPARKSLPAKLPKQFSLPLGKAPFSPPQLNVMNFATGTGGVNAQDIGSLVANLLNMSNDKMAQGPSDLMSNMSTSSDNSALNFLAGLKR